LHLTVDSATIDAMRRAVFRLLLIVLAMVVPLAIAEIAVRITMPQQLSGSWMADSGSGYDINRPGATAQHVLGDRAVRYRINDAGFRGGPVENARVRVLVLGDSVTFGWLLEEGDAYVTQIGARAAQTFGEGSVAVMNGAVGGWSTAEYVAFLEDRVTSIPPPSAVLVFLSGDETRRTVVSGLWKLSDGNLERVSTVRPKQTYRSLNRLPGYTLLIEHSHLANLARRVAFQSSQPARVALPEQKDERAIANGVELQNALMRRLASWCAERRLPLWVIATGYISLYGTDPEHEINRQFMKGAPNLFVALNVPYLDLTDDLAYVFDNESRYFIPVDYHPNEEAARLVAELAWPWLSARLSERLF
jgi:lysophospholipase L1-like esterase